MAGQRTRTVEFQDPSLTAARAAQQPGMEFLRELVAGTTPPPPLDVTLGFRLVEVQDGFARYEVAPGEHLYGPQKTVHTGVAGALLDGVMSAAVTTTLDAVTACSLATLTTHVTRPITGRALKLSAEGWVVHRGSRLVTAEGRITDAQGRLLAHGSSTFALVERSTP